jgi:hypothetical protein
MDETPSPVRPRRRWGRAAGLLGAGIVAGAILAGTMSAGAQTSGSSSSNSATSTVTAAASSGSHSESTETALTGTAAQKVRAAAQAAVPGGTIIRVETSRDGSSYEAHVRKADGTEVVVLMDKSFNVTSIDAHHCQDDSSA